MNVKEEKNLENNKTIKRQRPTSGAILQIIVDELYCYGQMIDNVFICLFDYFSSSPLDDFSILNKTRVYFIGGVYRDILCDGRWPKVSKSPIRKEFNNLVTYIHHDHSIGKYDEWELYDTVTGTITPTSREVCIGLPVTAIYDRNHIEDIIRCHIKNEPCIWLWQEYKLFPELYGDAFERIKPKLSPKLW